MLRLRTCVRARVKTLLSITVTTQISSCVYLVPPFSFVAHYAPVNGVHVRVRDSNRHPDHRRHFASVRTVNGENERRTDTRREKRTVSRQWEPRAVHVDEARLVVGAFFSPPAGCQSPGWHVLEREKKDIDGCNEITDDYGRLRTTEREQATTLPDCFARLSKSELVCYEYGHGITLAYWIDLSVGVNLCQTEEESRFFDRIYDILNVQIQIERGVKVFYYQEREIKLFLRFIFLIFLFSFSLFFKEDRYNIQFSK